MKSGLIKIELTEKQHKWLLRFLNQEWFEEVEYQKQNDSVDTDYLKDVLNVYEAVLGKTDSWIIAYSHNVDIEEKKKEIEELENETKVL